MTDLMLHDIKYLLFHHICSCRLCLCMGQCPEIITCTGQLNGQEKQHAPLGQCLCREEPIDPDFGLDSNDVPVAGYLPNAEHE